MYIIILKADGSYRGFTEDPNFDILALDDGTCTSVTVNQGTFNQLMTDLAIQTMKWNSITEQFEPSDNIEDAKEVKKKQAREYFLTRQKFLFNSNECWMNKEALRAYFIDISIQKADIVLDPLNACSASLKCENMSFGNLSGVSLALAEEIAIKVRCYMRVIETVLITHISNIDALNDINDVSNYNTNDLYPEFIEFTSGS